MNITIEEYTRIKFDNPKAIEFVEPNSIVGHNPFRIIDSKGDDSGYIGSFSPGKLAASHSFEVRKAELVEAMGKSKPGSDTAVLAMIPTGICVNTRIVAALLKLCYPDGTKLPDHKAIYEATDNRIMIELPSIKEAEDIIYGITVVRFDDYKLVNDLLAVRSTLNLPEAIVGDYRNLPKSLFP